MGEIEGHVVVDGQAGPGFDGIGDLLFSEDGLHTAYEAWQGDMMVVVLDGEPGVAYEEIKEGTLTLSSSGGRVAFVAWKGDRAVVVVDGEGHVVELNVKAASLFGYPRSELVGAPLETLIPERFRGGHVALQERYNRSPHVRPMGAGQELYVRHKDGHEFPVEINLGPYQSADGPFVVATIRALERGE